MLLLYGLEHDTINIILYMGERYEYNCLLGGALKLVDNSSNVYPYM